MSHPTPDGMAPAVDVSPAVDTLPTTDIGASADMDMPYQTWEAPSSVTESDASPLTRPSLRRNAFWMLAGTMVYAGCQWGTMVLVAKLLASGVVGRYGLAVAICVPVFMLCNLRLREVQATDARGQFRFRDFLAVRVVTSLFALLAVGALLPWLGKPRETILIILLVGVAKTVESLGDIIYGLFQKYEQMHRVATSLLLKGPLALLAMGTMLLLMHRSLAWGLVGVAGAWVAVLVLYDTPHALRILHQVGARTGALLRPRPLLPSLATMCRLAWLAFPLGVMAGLGSLFVNIPRYFIAVGGETALAHFVAMTYLMAAGNTVMDALAHSTSARLAHAFADDISTFTRLLWRLLAIGLALGVGGILVALTCGAQLLAVLYRPEYAREAHVFTWLMVAAGMNYLAIPLLYAMIAARRLAVQAVILAFSLLATVIGCAWLVPTYGMLGAAWALSAGFALRVLAACAVNMVAIRERRHLLLVQEVA